MQKNHRSYSIERDAEGLPVALHWRGDEVFVEPPYDVEVSGKRYVRREDGSFAPVGPGKWEQASR